MSRWQDHPRGVTWPRVWRVLVVAAVLLAAHAIITLDW